jgi:nonsense-mediated mRNA decay protein 3
MKILCCLCGTSIEPNDAAMCIDCLRAQFDIPLGIERNGEVVQCRKCERWHIKQDQWTYYPLESAGLLSACLRKIAGLGSGSMKLIDAAWVWTEPHSDRLKISIEVEYGVLDNKVQLRQKAVIEFVIKHKQCMECIREATDHSWGAMIQIRQKVGHKQALFLLEHLLTKAGLHNMMISITVCKEGLDLFFKARNQAEIVVNFISSHMPIKVKKSQKLISRDLQSNFSRFEITYHLEIAPVCKGDLVVTSKELSGSADLMVVTKLSSSVHLLSPTTLQKSELNSQKIFSTSPKLLTTVLTAKHLTSFVVLDINPVTNDSYSDILESDNGRKSRVSAVKEAGGLLAEAEVQLDAPS